MAFAVLQRTCTAHYAKPDKNTKLVKQPYSVIVPKVQLRQLREIISGPKVDSLLQSTTLLAVSPLSTVSVFRHFSND